MLKDNSKSKLKSLLIAVSITLSIFLIAGILAGGFDNSDSAKSMPDGTGFNGGVDEGRNSLKGVAGSVTRDQGEAPVDGDVKALENTNKSTTLENREVVTTGEVTLKVKKPSSSSAAFAAWVERNKGYVESLNETASDSEDYQGRIIATYTNSVITVRIANLRDAIAYLKKVDDGKILSQNINRDDVTAQSADIDARIAALKISISRLEEFLDKAEKYEDLFQIERELSARQQELDSYVAQRKALSSQISLNTLTVTFTATDKAANVSTKAREGFKDGILRGWNGVIDFLSGIVYGVANVIPWLIIFVPLGALAYFFYRRGEKKKGRKKESVDKE